MSLGSAQKLMEAARFDEAVAALGPAPESPARDPRRPLTLARIAEARGDREEALRLLAALRESRPQYVPGHLFYGMFALDAGQADAALVAFDRVGELQRENDLGRSYRALTFLHLGRKDEARDLFRTHGISDNRMFRVRLTEFAEREWLRDNCYFDQRPAPLPQRELFAVEQPENDGPLLPMGWLEKQRRERRATRSYLRKDYVEVLKALDPVARSARVDEGILFNAALAAEMLHDYELALSYLSVLPQDTSQWPDVLLALRGRLLVRMRRYAEAAEDLNRVEVIGPEDYGANYYFGVLCLAHGEPAQARKLFFRAHTQYLIDTLEYQWWEVEQAITS